MRILIATGGSPHSELALRFGAHMLSRVAGSLTILTVIKQPADRPRGEAVLARVHQLLDSTGVRLQTRIRVGHPAEEIIREAEEGNYDLVIVGEKQHHGLMTRFVLGSTAERVVEHAPCPVIIAKGKIGPVQRILLCDSNLEEPSLLRRLMTQLVDLVKDEKEEITVLHVMSQISAWPGVPGKQLRASAEELMQEHAPEGELLERDLYLLERLRLRAKPKIRHGLVVDEILAEAREGNYDLVVIGSHQGEGWRRILLDDLAHQIIVQMDRPILVVR
jgi:nucleotide-binding universal stress UspA family protein